MKIQINIQSYSDIITNSSSELFTIETDMSKQTFEEIWLRALNKKGYTNESLGSWDTYYGSIYEENGAIIISFPIMCNLDSDMYEFLEDLFGKENITYGN